jgi:hypothetical protein
MDIDCLCGLNCFLLEMGGGGHGADIEDGDDRKWR